VAALAPVPGSGGSQAHRLLGGREVVETEAEEEAGMGQVADSERGADLDRQIVDVWQAGDVGAGCDEDHGYVEAVVVVAAAVVVVVAGAGVAAGQNMVAEEPLFAVDAGTQEAVGQPWAVEVLEGHTVAGILRPVDTGCTAEEEVERQEVADMLVVEDDYVFAASGGFHHNRNLHTKHFVRVVALVAGEESMQKCKLRLPVAVVVELQPSRQNNRLEGQQVVDLEGVAVGTDCTSGPAAV